MSDEKPVLETSDEDFKAVLTAVVHSHKLSIDALDAKKADTVTLKQLWDRVNEVAELLNRHTKLLEANRFLTLVIWKHLGLPEGDDGEPKPMVH
jgi:hypothetical protein